MARLALRPEANRPSRTDGAVLETLLSSHGARAAELVALTDEGTLSVVESWPTERGPGVSDRSAWSESTWATYLQGLVISGEYHHVTAEGRAFYPLMRAGVLWGAVVVDPGEACPDALALALAPYRASLVESVRTRA